MNKPVVFIHGFGGGADIWQWQKEYFSISREVVLVDLPGHGVRPWGGESLDDMARLFYAQCQESSIFSTDIVASSFGGLVAIRLAELYPDFIRRIILSGALPRFMVADDFPAGLDAGKIRKLASQCEGDIGLILDMFFRSLFTRKEKERPRYYQIKELRLKFPLPCRAGLLGVLDLLEKEDLRDQFSRLVQPCLLITGDSDPICPLAVMEPLRRLLPAVQVEELKDASHFPFLSIPDVFNRRVERFLAV